METMEPLISLRLANDMIMDAVRETLQKFGIAMSQAGEAIEFLRSKGMDEDEAKKLCLYDITIISWE